MANEAVIVELLGNAGDVVRYTCGDNANISGGTILWFSDPRTVSGASIANGARPIAGIAAADKVAGDGATSVGVYTSGIFDCTSVAAPLIVAGDLVTLSGTNLIAPEVTFAMASGSKVLGKALETSSASEVILVKINT